MAAKSTGIGATAAEFPSWPAFAAGRLYFIHRLSFRTVISAAAIIYRAPLVISLALAVLAISTAAFAQRLPANATASAAAPTSREAMGAADARHLLARTGFGPTLSEIDEFSRLSRVEAVDRMLAGAVQNTAAQRADAAAALQNAPPAWVNEPIVPLRQIRNAGAEARREFQQQEIRRGFELRAWWIGEMLATPSPLAERMTLFWHNHFTSSQQKVRYTQLMYRQNALLRRHALGNFGDLLHRASRDPAMIVYLDSATNRKDHPNENFAREVMELFTLGEGHYSEADIREAARAFTGWSLDPDTVDFRWRPFVHDRGTKTLLGKSGNFDGDAVLDILLEQPQTAVYVVGKLWREFVSPDPIAPEVDRIAGAFRGSGYDIRVALRGLLLSNAFWAGENRASLIKSPAEFVVGTLRQFEVPVADATPLALVMAGLGQNLFSPPNVKGWPGGEAWINSGTLLARKQFVSRLFRGDEMQGYAMQAGDAMHERTGMADRRQDGAAQTQVTVLGRDLRARLRRGAENLQFDSAGWMAHFNGGGRGAKGGRHGEGSAVEAALERFVLAASPVNALPRDASGHERLRQLVLDPAYQLK